jgi:ATP-dependent RNA helicase RhlE
LNSNTTDSRPPRRRQSGPKRSTTRSAKTKRAQGTSAHAPERPAHIALEPTLCDLEPIPFESLGLDPRLLEGIRDLGFSRTRSIQSAVIPLALAGHDVIASAETGSGKTAAFVVPILQHVLTKQAAAASAQDTAPAVAAASRSRVLVLGPTRELAVQIEDEMHGAAYHTTVTSAAVYGGVEMSAQERALRAGVDIIVATPGRLMDHMRQQNADLSNIELLVLDEADRMMDMGFWPDVRRIISAIPGARQTLLFSATMPDEVVRLALEIVREPKSVQVGQRSKPAATITHRAHVAASGEKLEWLTDHLRRQPGPTLVFSRTKIGAERLAQQLGSRGIRCVSLHADRTQEQRRAAVEGFRGGRYKVLVATDIAARGLDIDGIHTVINFELPDSPDTYVHRVGRTGRAGEVGLALTLVLPDELHDLAQLEKAVGVRLEFTNHV